MTGSESRPEVATVLVVEDDVLVRTAIADYLRDCGYRVIEAAGADEALAVLGTEELRIDVMLSSVEMRGEMDGFTLSQRVRNARRDVEVILAGTTKRATESAADLCKVGPTLAHPYEPQIVHDRIKRMLAARAAKKPAGG